MNMVEPSPLVLEYLINISKIFAIIIVILLLEVVLVVVMVVMSPCHFLRVIFLVPINPVPPICHSAS